MVQLPMKAHDLRRSKTCSDQGCRGLRKHRFFFLEVQTLQRQLRSEVKVRGEQGALEDGQDGPELPLGPQNYLVICVAATPIANCVVVFRTPALGCGLNPNECLALIGGSPA